MYGIDESSVTESQWSGRKYAPGWSWANHDLVGHGSSLHFRGLECSEVSLQGVSKGIKFIFCVSVHLVFQVGHSREAERTLRKIFQGSGWEGDGGGLD